MSKERLERARQSLSDSHYVPYAINLLHEDLHWLLSVAEAVGGLIEKDPAPMDEQGGCGATCYYCPHRHEAFSGEGTHAEDCVWDALKKAWEGK